jgi:hypothetical protein
VGVRSSSPGAVGTQPVRIISLVTPRASALGSRSKTPDDVGAKPVEVSLATLRASTPS